MSNPKFSQEQLDQVVSLYESGVSKTEIARRMNMHKCTVGNIIQRRSAEAAKENIPADVQAHIEGLKRKVAELTEIQSRLQNGEKRIDELRKEHAVLLKDYEALKKVAEAFGIPIKRHAD